ncbi:peptidase M20 [Halothiobacillus diazotrophicus]|uniref:Peptidase M20 n=1 Tax=Halothiobacillus diazotrophicus TaxID=1860122 RepID=A0A191ZGA2_9GAMM|nr:N(2)-acetyl-L-2,4-diaminobutanoate deacetylase DoeB2 [Halothiobacillus diazotrophicus]ANJ66882.1 peptidase M20 [Halothiobacillus diazotrophicus]
MSSTWTQYLEDATQLRRALHRAPELTWQEHATARTIRDALTHHDIPWRSCAGTGTVATLAPTATGRHIALRGDIDALPITEQTGAEWASLTPGIMHACGHDGHTAVLMAVARWLKSREHELPGPVSLLFQPAEEGGHGARAMIEDGALEGVDWIFGWHNWPAIPFGRAICPDGPIMAANAVFEIELTGSGGHASQPELCRDPVLAAAAITLNLQQIVSRRLPPQTAAVVSVTSINAPSGITVIPETARLAGSVRVADTNTRALIGHLITEIAEWTAHSYGVRAHVVFTPRYQATVNHPEPALHYRGAIEFTLGADWCNSELPVPIMASEDFSYYLEAIPGAFALIGANDGAGHDEPCHSPRYDFNDRLLDPVGRILASLIGVSPP